MKDIVSYSKVVPIIINWREEYWLNIFQCENQVEDLEDTILEIFAEEGENRDIELCAQR